MTKTQTKTKNPEEKISSISHKPNTSNKIVIKTVVGIVGNSGKESTEATGWEASVLAWSTSWN